MMTKYFSHINPFKIYLSMKYLQSKMSASTFSGGSSTKLHSQVKGSCDPSSHHILFVSTKKSLGSSWWRLQHQAKQNKSLPFFKTIYKRKIFFFIYYSTYLQSIVRLLFQTSILIKSQSTESLVWKGRCLPPVSQA